MTPSDASAPQSNQIAAAEPEVSSPIIAQHIDGGGRDDGQ